MEKPTFMCLTVHKAASCHIQSDQSEILYAIDQGEILYAIDQGEMQSDQGEILYAEGPVKQSDQGEIICQIRMKSCLH